MRQSFVALSDLALVTTLVATPAMAQEEAAPAIAISGSATLVTDYRFRGISQTNKRFAMQGSLTISHESGLYATVWGSSIDDYVAAANGDSGSDQEIDFIVGYAKTFGPTKVDFGVRYYYYPGSVYYPDSDRASTDFVESYLALSHSLGPASAKISAAYAPKQAAIGLGYPNIDPGPNGFPPGFVPHPSGFFKKDNFYLAADFSTAMPNTGLGLTAHVGHSFNRSALTFSDKYTDWSLGATYTIRKLVFGVSYVDTDRRSIDFRDVRKAGVVASVGVVF